MVRVSTSILQECIKASSKTFANREKASNRSQMATNLSDNTRTENQTVRASTNVATAHIMRVNLSMALKKGKVHGMKTLTLIMKARCIKIKNMVRGLSTIRMEVI